MTKNRLGAKVITVTPEKSSEAKSLEMNSKATKRKLCFCGSHRLFMTYCRLFGLCCLTSFHKDRMCDCKTSWPWMIYSALLVAAYLYLFTVDISSFKRSLGQPLPFLLNSFSQVIYLVLMISLTVFCAIRTPKLVNFIHAFQTLYTKNDLLCQNSLRNYKRSLDLSTLFFTVGFLLICIYVLCIFYYTHEMDHELIINRFVQNVPIAFTLMLRSIFNMFAHTFACFERLTMKLLNYSNCSASSCNEKSNTWLRFMGIFKIEYCTEDHDIPNQLDNLTRVQKIEYLRILHEDIAVIMNKMNNYFNPQLLLHVTIELIVLIIKWYEVVIYRSLNADIAPPQSLYLMNWLHVVVHTGVLLVLLKSSQDLINMIHGLNDVLRECAIKAKCGEELLQFRIFVEKIKQQRPFTANDMFDINLGIVGPISANILTYVLVALQFNINPK